MVPEQQADELELRDYLRVLRRRKWVILGTALVVVGAALGASFMQTPVYQGTAQVLLQPRSTESLFDPSTGQRSDPNRAVQTELQVLKTKPVRDAVRAQLGAAPPVSASPVGQTDVIEVQARSTDPQRAAAVANAYANSYIDFRRRQAVEDLLAASRHIQERVDDLQAQLNALGPPPEPRRGELTPVDPNEGRRSTLLQQQALFKQKLDQLQVDAALKTGGAQLITPASPPTLPVEPTPRRDGVLALALGLIAGIGLAFLFEYLDETIRGREDLERAVPGRTVLGMIPAVSGWKDRKRAYVVSLSEPGSAAAEAYRALRTSIQFLGLDRPLRTLQVTSPSASEGKSATLANLAVALAQAGQRVIVVCCDLRRPRLHEFFGLSNEVGFTSVLLGEVPLSAALQPVPDQDRLVLLASGPPPPNPSELLSGHRTVEVLTALQTQADVVLIDCPPVLPVTDAAVLSSRVDSTLVIATAGSTRRKEIQRALELLQQVDAPIVGLVLNGVGKGSDGYGSGYGYGYGYGYGPKEQPPAQRRDRRRKVKAATPG